MQPSIVISLFFLFGTTIVVCLTALLFPKKIRRVIWIISLSISIMIAGFYVVRPYIVKHQTTEAVEELDFYLGEKYPNETWGITDTDNYHIQSEVILHVIFNNEPKVVYKYIVSESKIEQVDMWLKTGDSVYENDTKPQHYEPRIY